MMWVDKDKIPERKGRHLPKATMFREFEIGCDNLEKIQDFLVRNYRFKVGIVRNYDLEGYIGDLRLNKFKDRNYHH